MDICSVYGKYKLCFKPSCSPVPLCFSRMFHGIPVLCIQGSSLWVILDLMKLPKLFLKSHFFFPHLKSLPNILSRQNTFRPLKRSCFSSLPLLLITMPILHLLVYEAILFLLNNLPPPCPLPDWCVGFSEHPVPSLSAAPVAARTRWLLPEVVHVPTQL